MVVEGTVVVGGMEEDDLVRAEGVVGENGLAVGIDCEFVCDDFLRERSSCSGLSTCYE